ncbi:hypothetical protein EK21DRAFT_57040 [Setomelanomma holmii]|uniref:Uncharacterized protein n=1 Tax=Setomelanomma holmii TaxID=210430 RepID=A0A9P4HFJ6_9PLEO|nr:hypothetical protein EK21DRAFT_57040 [Setomelanomma holmii]
MAKSQSAIDELQTVFGTLLLARKDPKPPTNGTSAWNPYTVTYEYIPALPSSPPLPKWTGSFALFAFPRELRDRIYFYYLHRPKGVIYHRKTHRNFPFTDHSEDITSLFLTSQQVYSEALQVFCRHNQIEIKQSGYSKYGSKDSTALAGTLGLFPDKPGRLVQRVRKPYREYMHMYGSHDNDLLGQKARDAWLQMLRDAYTFKNFFPKLREFTVCWEANPRFFAPQDNLAEEKTEEEKVRIWLGRMKKWMEGRNVVPPRWVRFELGSGWKQSEVQHHTEALNRAYARLTREGASWDEQQTMLEESGRKWLEDVSRKTSRKRKKSKHNKNCDWTISKHEQLFAHINGPEFVSIQ